MLAALESSRGRAARIFAAEREGVRLPGSSIAGDAQMSAERPHCAGLAGPDLIAPAEAVPAAGEGIGDGPDLGERERDDEV